jgi:type I restriction-modification system DNA methylase subunit
LAAKAKVGVLTDGISTFWLHNMDSSRRNDIKLVKNQEGLYTEELTPERLEAVLKFLDSSSDTLDEPQKRDPSRVARSVWQSIYIATRETPERCFQTFVELFTYKLLSDCELLPNNLRIDYLVADSKKFKSNTGRTQIDYYLQVVRPHIKQHLFPPLNAPEHIDEVFALGGTYHRTQSMLINGMSLTSKGATSVIDGHAFQKNSDSHNDAFVNIVSKLNAIENIRSLDPGFKSRVYEQFLRRDQNITKVSGKYFTPRNVVRAIVQIADVVGLPHNATICDPACGVGGFITESLLALEKAGIKPFRETRDGHIETKFKFMGLDCEYDVVCLAKSNFLLHTIEFFNSLSSQGKSSYQKLLADTFVWCHRDTELGSLYHPADAQFDIIMANPPYIVSGTGSVTRKIKSTAGLSAYYSAGGSGLESRFLNWMVNALKGGGRAFVVLPKAMFARTEKSLKAFIIEKCFIDALIYLPTNSFYTTPVETYILGLRKKSDEHQNQTDPIFCYLTSEIGETRDVKRDPTKNDLVEMTSEYRQFKNNPANYTPSSSQCKIAPIDLFDPEERWDFDYLWDIEEKRTLGIIDRTQLSVDDLIERFSDVVNSLQQSQKVLGKSLSHSGQFRSVLLKDEKLFVIHRGHRVTKKECQSNQGDIIVIASGRHKDSYFARVSPTFLMRKFRQKSITTVPGYFTSRNNVVSVGATGSVGVVHVREEEKWFLHDDALAVEILDPKIDVHYFRYALQQATTAAQFNYCAKLYQKRLANVEVKFPTDENGAFDLEAQRALALVYTQQEKIKQSVFNTVQDLLATDVTY